MAKNQLSLPAKRVFVVQMHVEAQVEQGDNGRDGWSTWRPEKPTTSTLWRNLRRSSCRS
jgi:hypothetical protein